MSSIQTYIQYVTQTGVKYYYDSATKQTTYQFPSTSIIIDSKTKQIIYAPPGVKAKIAQQQQELQAQDATNSSIQSPTTQPNIQQISNFQTTGPKLGPRSLQPNLVNAMTNLNPPSPTNQIQVKPPNPAQMPPVMQISTQMPQSTSPTSRFPQANQLGQQQFPQANQSGQQQFPQMNQSGQQQFPQMNHQPMHTGLPPAPVQHLKPIQPNSPFVHQSRVSTPLFNPLNNQMQPQQNNINYQQQQLRMKQQQQLPAQKPQIQSKSSMSDIPNYAKLVPQSSTSKSITASSSGDVQYLQPINLLQQGGQNHQNAPTFILNQTSYQSTSVNQTPNSSLDSVPLMPDFLVPAQAIHDFSPWSIIKMDFPQVDPINYSFPQIKLSKDASNFQSDNPFDYPEKIQLGFNSSGSGFESSILDNIEGSSTADDESSSGRPNSVRASASLLINDIEIKTPYLVIEMLANSFKVSPNSITTKSGLLELINKYQFTEFAQENFRKPNSNSSTKKGGSQFDEELSFSDKPLQKPLSKKLTKNLKPFGTTISTSILQFMGVIQGYNQIIVAHNLCQIIQPHQDLIDETYFQIIKQATNNPNPNWTQNCFLLFLIVCTLFKPRKSNRFYILSWAAHHLLDNNFKIREFFSFSMIRFESRFLRGTFKDEITINAIKSIPSQIEKARTLFDCSIFEIMWAQRKKYPLLPIPIPLALIIQELVKKNAVKTPNLLDLPSDNEKVELVAVNMLNEQKSLESLNVGDLMGLLKNWLLSISDPLISRSTFNNFLHYENPMEYTNNIPSAHRDSLKFLVGFLKDILNNDEENNSTGTKLANIFGPLIVDPTEIVHSREIYDAIIARSSEFLKGVLFSWQTDDIYPLPNDLLEPPKKDKIFNVRTNLNAQNLRGPQAKRNSVCPIRAPPISTG